MPQVGRAVRRASWPVTRGTGLLARTMSIRVFCARLVLLSNSRAERSWRCLSGRAMDGGYGPGGPYHAVIRLQGRAELRLLVRSCNGWWVRAGRPVPRCARTTLCPYHAVPVPRCARTTLCPYHILSVLGYTSNSRIGWPVVIATGRPLASR